MKVELRPVQATLLYLLFGALWILLSDRVLVRLAANPAVYRPC